jgi:DNA-binding LytR/AlgR family response regulator
MTAPQSVASDGIHVVVCVAFDHRIPPHEIAACRKAVINCPSVLSSMELSGTFDFMFEAVVPDMAAYKNALESCSAAVAKFASRFEVNFVCEQSVRAESTEQALWVPSEHGLMRLDCSVIDKVKAEGDYVRIHSDGRTWMLHTTMVEMLGRLSPDDFVQVHRSTIIRCSFIERLRYEGHVWTARLNDGSTERVAKSKAAQLLAKLRANSALPEAGWAKSVHPSEPDERSERKAVAPLMAD